MPAAQIGAAVKFNEPLRQEISIFPLVQKQEFEFEKGGMWQQ
jgi:hypothetical protein